MSSKVKIAMVGVGYWGPNLLRNFNALSNVEVTYICDLNKDKLRQFEQLYPQSQCVNDLEIVLQDEQVQAVIIATSAETHFALAQKALLANKHVYVEKPLTLNPEHAQELIQIAQQRNKQIMVGHLLMYHPAIQFMRQHIQSKEFGELRYMYCTRVNLGKVRQDTNAWWNLAPHDISVMMYLAGQEPTQVEAKGQCYVQSEFEDVVFASLQFPNSVMGHIHVSWLDPHKVRKITVVGSKQMIVFDDMDSAEKLKIYHKAVHRHEEYDSYDQERLSIQDDGYYVPKLDQTEPLRLECEHFIDCVEQNKPPLSDGDNGLAVLKVLHVAEEQMKQQRMVTS